MNAAFARYGSSLRLTDGEGWYSPVYKAFLQPLRYKNKMYLEGVYTPIGRDVNGIYLYVGPAGHDVTRLSSQARILAADGRQFVIQRAEKVSLSDKPFYFWAVVKEVSEVKP